MFDQYTSNIRRRLQGDLPGLDAQLFMAPQGRNSRLPDPATITNAKRGSVLVLIYPHLGEPHLVLMKRNEYPGVHSGQISFPGGTVEKTDPNTVFTALREAEEEVGVNPDKVEVIGQLSQLYIPPSNFLVDPIVGRAFERPEFVPDHTEVQEILEVPLTHLFNPSNRKETEIPVAKGLKFQAPYFDVYGHIVWGATAMMLSELQVLIEG